MIKIADYIIDTATSIEVQNETDLTDQPVEVGSDFTDHARTKPVEVTIRGIVSNSPIGDITSVRDAAGAPPASDAYAYMLELQAAKEPIRIEIPDGVFENMILRSLRRVIDASTGDALSFAVSFRQIDIVESERALVRVEIPKPPGGKRDRGKKPSKKENVDNIGTIDQSWATQGFNWAKGLLN